MSKNRQHDLSYFINDLINFKWTVVDRALSTRRGQSPGRKAYRLERFIKEF